MEPIIIKNLSQNEPENGQTCNKRNWMFMLKAFAVLTIIGAISGFIVYNQTEKQENSSGIDISRNSSKITYPAPDMAPPVNSAWTTAILGGKSIPAGGLDKNWVKDFTRCNSANAWAFTYDDGPTANTQSKSRRNH